MKDKPNRREGIPSYPLVRLDALQLDIDEWVKKNFATHPLHHPLLGLVEEVGELSHAVLKREQKIRLNENHDAEIRDAVGDILIYLIDFCNAEAISISNCLQETWGNVKKRDWNEHRTIYHSKEETNEQETQ